ncbi:response regulator transcription factor [Pedobacter sp. L105]|uniref:response regulator transcription factor n=1 Tax=Pedobacter sp. L105 TaxID=1641871 RepID=UPI00131C3215|nr:helix-turn-helix domain-containing protein [Pedobacter sp. L105]
MTKTLSKNKNSWLNYLHRLKDKTGEKEKLELTGFDDFFNANDFAHSFLLHSIPFVYLLDYQRGTYINMSENFAGYKADLFLKGGIHHLLEIYHPDHFQVFDSEIFPGRLQILKNIKPQEHQNYVFTYNLCIKNKEGKFENFLQRNCFLSDEIGNPLFSMGILMNIDHHKNGNSVVQTVDKVDAYGLIENKAVFKQIFYLNEEDKLFSKREKEVLLWMADGLSSKMIANKLNISENTVVNHRRSMQDKSNMPNATALVSFAIRSEII